MRITEFLQQHKTQVDLLDLEILLAHIMHCSREYLYIHPEQPLSIIEIKMAEDLIAARKTGLPVAYLIGSKEFWSRRFIISPHTLIPRPETEHLIEAVLNVFPIESAIKALDLGTGSGNIACILALERPKWEVVAIDKSHEALEIAQQNANDLQLNNIEFLLSDWFLALKNKQFNLIVANPPYINADHYDQQLKYEPYEALYSEGNGLYDISFIIKNAPNFLTPAGILILEHGYDQLNAIRSLVKMEPDLELVGALKDLSQLDRIVIIRKI